MLQSIYNEKALFFANTAHQLLTKIYFPLPLQWTICKHQWEYNEKICKPHIITSFVYKTATAICCSAVLIHGKYNFVTMSETKVITLLLEIFGMILFGLTDYMMHETGRELATGINWSYQKSKWLRHYGKHFGYPHHYLHNLF